LIPEAPYISIESPSVDNSKTITIFEERFIKQLNQAKISNTRGMNYPSESLGFEPNPMKNKFYQNHQILQISEANSYDDVENVQPSLKNPLTAPIDTDNLV
jgi:hypothetical protein